MAEETPIAAAPEPSLLGARLKWILVALALLGLAVLAWLVFRAAGEDKRMERWDQYSRLREQYEGEDPYFSSSAPLYRDLRERYAEKLEALLGEVEPEGTEDALAPQIRWRIVKTLGETLMSMGNDVEGARRRPLAERAIKHLNVLQERYPDFPLNWTGLFAPAGSINQTRRMLDWFTKNLAWQDENLPQAVVADADPTLVFRTTRGDIHMGLYASQAPAFTALVRSRVVAGGFDGTSFTARVEESAGGDVSLQALRAGDARSLSAPAYDRAAHLKFAESAQLDGLLPDDSRNRILHVRGVVTSWHDKDSYDDPEQLLFVVRNSPGLNYKHTPVGRVRDDASLATLDRIFKARLWRENPAVASDSGSPLKDMLQVPVAIVKALLYVEGKLVEPTAATGTAATRVAPDASEQTLAGLKRDAYLVEEPAPPAPPAPVK